MASKLNKNNSAVKRIMAEAREVANDPSTDYAAEPLEDDIFEWHCTLRGPEGTEFEGGLYHFRILLPAEYPFRPPSLMMLTPNGRFELNTKICISFTNYHEELWQPAWGVRTAIVGLQGFFPLKGQQAVGIGSIEYPPAERKRLAALSREWVCPHCQQKNLDLLPDPVEPSDATEETSNPELRYPDSFSEVSAQRPPGSTTPPNSDVPTLEEISNPTSATHVHSVHAVVHSTNSGSNSSPRSTLATRAGVDTPTTNTTDSRRERSRPPVLLDSAICILLVMAFAILCRRVI